MKVVRQDANRNRLKPVTIDDEPISFAEVLDVTRQQIVRAIGERYGKEEGSALYLGPTVS